MCSSLASDLESKNKQENELATTAANLAECQETIFLLGRQLNSFHPQSSVASSPLNESDQRVFEGVTEEEPATSGSGTNTRVTTYPAEIDPTNPCTNNTGAESPPVSYIAPSSPAENGRSAMSLKSPKHRRTRSGSSSASSTPTPEKHVRGFSRFFS